jgi:hypothetical protein
METERWVSSALRLKARYALSRDGGDTVKNIQETKQRLQARGRNYCNDIDGVTPAVMADMP